MKKEIDNIEVYKDKKEIVINFNNDTYKRQKYKKYYIYKGEIVDIIRFNY